MDRVENIKSIQIDLGEEIKIEITRIETVKKEVFEKDTFEVIEVPEQVIEVIVIGYDEHEKRSALDDFLTRFQLHDKTKIEVK